MTTPINTRFPLFCVSALLVCLVAVPGLLAATHSTRENSLVRVTGNIHPGALAKFDRGRAADTLPQQHILMLLRRTAPRERALTQFIARQYDPHSPDYHRWLTPRQFGARFGPPKQDIREVTNWLGQQGFTVNQVPAGGLFVDFSGTAGQVARAFHTEIHRYQVHGVDHYASAGDPYLPASLAKIVTGFRALNDFHPQPHLRNAGTAKFDRQAQKWSRQSNTAGAQLTSATDALYIVGPQDFANIYGVNQVWQESAGAPGTQLVGTGQTIAVVGETNVESADIQNFRDQFGTTALGPNGSVVNENPPASVCAAPGAGENEPESYLDAEWSGAMAPDATIDFVACGRQTVTSGADLAAAYVIADAAHVQRIGVLSTSYGDCETLPQSEANQFYVSLWQQAAVEGITVVVAAGDNGADGCQFVENYAIDGLTLDNEASTPYNIAAGGTDFSDVFSGTTSTYWSAANGANLASAQSYIPETPWNETCASPLVLARFGQAFANSTGANGFCTAAARQPVDPATGYSPFFFALAGGGGLSAVSARPSWQVGVPGLPAQAGRAVPDISMFASGGLTWGQTLILCDSALANLPAGTACDFTNANDVTANDGGGTSFVAPAFAGIMALINQKHGGRQGQANNVLYPLAAQQYVTYGGSTQPNLANCAAYLGPQALSSCYFHDVSATPNTVSTPPFINTNTQVPCTGTATGPGVFTDASTGAVSNKEDCDGYQIDVTQSGSTLTTTPIYYGGMVTADNAPAFAATPGYDLATGLGSPNVYSLVNAPQWSGGLQTSVQLSAIATNITDGQSLFLTVTVADKDGAPVVGGTVTLYAGNTLLGTFTQACAAGGVYHVAVPGSMFGTVGSYPNVFAAFAGGVATCQQQTATYYGSQSAPLTVAISPERLGPGAIHLPASVPRPPQPAQ